MTYRQHPLDAQIAEVLPPGSLYAVGGRVRDELRGVPVKDLDYVVAGLALDEVTRRLERIGRVDLVGASFAVLKLTASSQTVDVALPRRDRSTGLHHRDFEVQSGPNVTLEEDLERRDFRMNAVARSLPGGALVDPYGGAADIAAARIDILRPQAFEEDPLRMLRAAQFAARFDFAPTAGTLEAMARSAPLAATVSAERLCEELTKLLVHAARPSIGFELLRGTGVLAHVIPELLEGVGVEQNEWHAYDVWCHSLVTLDAAPPGDLILRLAALFHDVAKPRTKDGPHFYRHEIVGAELTRDVLSRLRFSNEVVAATEHLVRQHMYVADPEMKDNTLRRFIRRVGPAAFERQHALRMADVAGSGLPKRGDQNERFAERVRQEIARKPAFSVADLAIGGDEVIAALVRRGEAPAGFAGDERVGAALRWLFEQVTDEPGGNERQTLLRLLDEHLGRDETIGA